MPHLEGRPVLSIKAQATQQKLHTTRSLASLLPYPHILQRYEEQLRSVATTVLQMSSTTLAQGRAALDHLGRHLNPFL